MQQRRLQRSRTGARAFLGSALALGAVGCLGSEADYAELEAHGDDSASAVDKIVDGLVVDNLESEAPGIARLTFHPDDPHTSGNPPEGFCGATLIARGWLVTAAHCFKEGTEPAQCLETPALCQAHIGEEFWYDHWFEDSFHEIANVYVHRDYNPTTLNHDIALIELVDFDALPTPRPAVLTDAQMDFVPLGADMVAAGWGATEQGGFAETGELMKTRWLDYEGTGSTCENGTGFGSHPHTVTSNQFCAFHRTSAPCNADSGGPIYYRGPDGSLFMAGIVSASSEEGECANDLPVLYTRISNYLGRFEEDFFDAFGDTPGDRGFSISTRRADVVVPHWTRLRLENRAYDYLRDPGGGNPVLLSDGRGDASDTQWSLWVSGKGPIRVGSQVRFVRNTEEIYNWNNSRARRAQLHTSDPLSRWKVESASGAPNGAIIEPGEYFRLVNMATVNGTPRRMKGRDGGVRVYSGGGSSSEWRIRL